jgi:hypothetical protein
MHSHCIPLTRRIVALTVVFLVLFLLLPVNIALGGYSYETAEWFELRKQLDNYASLTESEIESFAKRMEGMTAEGFNAALENVSAFWSDEQKQGFVIWMLMNHLICSPCSTSDNQLFTTFTVPQQNSWPANIPTPKQGNIVTMTKNKSISAYVIGGTTRLTYEELKSRTEASGDWLVDFKGNGQTQPEADTAKKFETYSKMLAEYTNDFMIKVADVAYYSRANGKGLLGLAFGSSTTMLIVSQDKPKHTAVDPYPLIYTDDMTAAQKHALVLTLLNMDTENMRQAISSIETTLSDDDFLAFLAFLDEEVHAYSEDVYERFVSTMYPMK